MKVEYFDLITAGINNYKSSPFQPSITVLNKIKSASKTSKLTFQFRNLEQTTPSNDHRFN